MSVMNQVRGLLRRKRRTAAVLTAVLLTAGLASCGNNDGSKPASSNGSGLKARTIGYVDVTHAAGQQLRWYSFFKAATDKLGWDVKLVDTKGAPAAANAGIQTLVSRGVDAIAVSCWDSKTVQPGINAAHRAHIPIIEVGCLDSESGNQWDAWYGGPGTKLTNALADFVLQKVKAGDEVAVQELNVLETTRIFSTVLNTRLKDAGVSIVEHMQNDLTDPTKAGSLASGAVRAHPHLKAIIATINVASPPTITALKQLNRNDVSVYSYVVDALQLPLLTAPHSVLKGIVDGPVEQLCMQAVTDLLMHFEKGDHLGFRAEYPVDGIKVYTAADAPKLTKGFLGPYSPQQYIQKYVDEWNTKLGLHIS
jgi:ABC-type sugar transport system substrate-binding protein